MQTTFIYGLECPLTKHIRYVGKSNNPNNRVKNHIYEYKIGKSSNNLKEEWFDILMEKDLRPIMIILDEVPMDEWGYWERWWLELIKSWGFDTVNLVQGGNGCSTHAKETIEKIRNSVSGENNARGFQGRKHTEETKKKMSESLKGHKTMGFSGKTHTEETKKKMSEVQKKRDYSYMVGINRSDETKRKISDKLKGHESKIKGKTYEELYGIEKANERKKQQSDNRKGYKMSEETKKKISEFRKGRKLSEETKQKMRERALERERIKRGNGLTND